MALAVAPTVQAAPSPGCATKSCAQRVCDSNKCKRRVAAKRKARAIAPYREWLAKTGQCESDRSPGGRSLKRGLRALSPGGKFRGRYQFDMPSWRAAGGSGDPINADWLEQAYRAVRWRLMVGTGAWPNCG